MDTLLNLYLLYSRLEQERSKSADNRTPIVYYALDLFGKHMCDNRNSSLISGMLDTDEKINDFVNIASMTTKRYLKRKQKVDENLDYNHLIKLPVDYDLIDILFEDSTDDYYDNKRNKRIAS